MGWMVVDVSQIYKRYILGRKSKAELYEVVYTGSGWAENAA